MKTIHFKNGERLKITEEEYRSFLNGLNRCPNITIYTGGTEETGMFTFVVSEIVFIA